MAKEAFKAKYFTHDQIRRHGALGSLNEGVVIRIHNIETRLIAWPGNGYQTESVHALTLKPGEQSSAYTYSLAEEALLCVAGRGEAYLRDRWVAVQPGDLAYFPEGVQHAVRSQASNSEDFVLVSQITPPQFDLYAADGFYNVALGVMNFDAAFRAGLNAAPGRVAAPLAFAYRETELDVRPWKLSAQDVRRQGALFNVFMGAEFDALKIPARLILWPGAGCRTAGFNFAFCPEPATDFIHTHPVSDECLFLWAGKGMAYNGSDWRELETLDCILAPCGVFHGTWGVDGPQFWGGFASPPQLDLAIKTPYYRDGVFSQAPFQRLTIPETAETRSLFRG